MGLMGLALVAYLAVVWVGVNELNRRLGREATALETIVYGLCFPYSLMFVLFLMPEPPARNDDEGNGVAVDPEVMGG